MMLLAAALVVLVAQAPLPQPGGAPEEKLHGLIFGGDELTDRDAARAPEPVRARLAAFIARREAFRSRIPPVPNEDPDGKDLWAARRAIERTIVALVPAPGVEAEAERFARAVPLYWEYEGFPEGPLAEAAFAEGYLKKAPQGPLVPYLYLFIAARQRVAFETYAQAAPPVSASAAVEGMRATAKKYRAFVQRARAHQDVLVRLIVDDIDRQPFLYLKTGKHPRDFNPDT